MLRMSTTLMSSTYFGCELVCHQMEFDVKSKKRLVRPDQILEMLGVSRVTLWKYIRDGKFPAPIKIGASRFWDEVEVNEWFDRARSQKNS